MLITIRNYELIKTNPALLMYTTETRTLVFTESEKLFVVEYYELEFYLDLVENHGHVFLRSGTKLFAPQATSRHIGL